jgi:hypothetical protein
MTGSFESWFKQCDESILNDAVRATSGNISLGKTPPPRRVSLQARKTSRNRGSEASQ